MTYRATRLGSVTSSSSFLKGGNPLVHILYLVSNYCLNLWLCCHVFLWQLQKSRTVCFVVPVKMVRYGIQRSSSSEKGDVSHKSFRSSPEQEAEVCTQDFSSPVLGSDPTWILQDKYEHMKFEHISWALPILLKNQYTLLYRVLQVQLMIHHVPVLTINYSMLYSSLSKPLLYIVRCLLYIWLQYGQKDRELPFCKVKEKTDILKSWVWMSGNSVKHVQIKRKKKAKENGEFN